MLSIGITGNNGFVGWHLSSRIKINKSHRLINFKREYFNNQTLLDEFVNKCDIIVHLAAVNRHPDEEFLYNENIRLSEILIKSFIRTKFCGKVFFSSSIQESYNNNFGNSKKECREIFTRWSNDAKGIFIGLIIPNIFGPFGLPNYNSVVSTFCNNIIQNKPLKIVNDNELKILYIDNLINQIISLFELNESKSKIVIKHDIEMNVSEILKKIQNMYQYYVTNMIIPHIENEFDNNLFNTLRSFIDYESFFPCLYMNNIDERGNFIELLKIQSGGQISYSTTKPGITRGNHFHTRKIERFSVISGKALIQFRKIGTNKTYKFEIDSDNPGFVDMPIWYTHNIKNIGKSELITVFWINEFYNENDSDTYFEKV